jgi:hypothetical protein
MSIQSSAVTMTSPLHIALATALLICSSCCFVVQAFAPSVAVTSNRDARTSVLFAGRRQVLTNLAGIITPAIVISVAPAHAGEVGARITKAVTTSDLGLSVRRSVVQGAQTMDSLDGKWEKFSDRFGLGAERNKKGQQPKIIPPLKPLDTTLARQVLSTCDQVFCDVTGVSPSVLSKQVETVRALVKPSFERVAGTPLGDDDPSLGSDNDGSRTSSLMENADQFNFASYVHFRAYSTVLLSEKNMPDYRTFRRAFEEQCGTKLLALVLSTSPISASASASSLSKKEQLAASLDQIQSVTTTLRDKGFVAATEVSYIDADLLADWQDDLAELQFNVALDGDATQNAQILLQEQGYNLIPSYTKFLLRPIFLSGAIKDQTLTIEEYYMDTNYNSNPDLFQVREVLLNIVLESK